MDIPLQQEVSNPEEVFSNSKVEDLGTQASEEEEAVTITVTRGIYNVIVAINLGTIALNAEGKLRWKYVSKSTMQRR